MTHHQDPAAAARTIGETLRQIGDQFSKAMADAMDQIQRTVTLVLPKPDDTAGELAVWSGDGWRVELAGEQITITGGCQHGETTAVAAAMIAADRVRAARAAERAA